MSDIPQIRIDVDMHEVTDELDRLLRGPGIETFLAYSAAFAEAYAEVVSIMHVETGSLKSTAKFDSPAYPEGWQGTLRVGGAAPGMIRDPAYYGVYELARGGTHFFFAPAYDTIPDNMINATLKFLSGGVSELGADVPKPPSVAKVGKQAAEDVGKNKTTEEAHTAAKKASTSVGKLSGTTMSKSDTESYKERVKKALEEASKTVSGAKKTAAKKPSSKANQFYLGGS